MCLDCNAEVSAKVLRLKSHCEKCQEPIENKTRASTITKFCKPLHEFQKSKNSVYTEFFSLLKIGKIAIFCLKKLFEKFTLCKHSKLFG